MPSADQVPIKSPHSKMHWHKGTSNNTRFRRFLSWLSGRSQRSCRGESPIGDRFDAWPASVLCTMPHGLHPWAHSSGCSCHSLELNQPADVVAEVHHADLESRSHDADGAHDLAAHRVLLLAEYVLDTGAHLRARRVRRLLAL